MMMTSSDDNFLLRWSRRKVRSRDGIVDDSADGGERIDATDREAPQMQQSAVRETGAAEPGHTPDRPLTEDDFAHIDFDALDFDSDYTRFMGRGVPDAIRNKALRKLWASNPVLANIDGLDDYCEDFSDAVWAEPNLKTAYRIGKGFLTDEEADEWDRLGKPEPEPDVAAVAAVDGSDLAEQPTVATATEQPDEGDAREVDISPSETASQADQSESKA
jgi:hypothetical protein